MPMVNLSRREIEAICAAIDTMTTCLEGGTQDKDFIEDAEIAGGARHKLDRALAQRR